MKGKQFYQHCLDMLAKGFFVLAQEQNNKQFTMFTHMARDSVMCTGWGILEGSAKRIVFIGSFEMIEDNFSGYQDIKVIDYYRPNDIFPSKPFEVGDRVRVSTDGPEEVKGSIVTIDKIEHHANDGLDYFCSDDRDSYWICSKHLYPALPEEEKVDATEEAIKLLKEKGFKIIKE